MSSFIDRRTAKKLVHAYQLRLAAEEGGDMLDDESERYAEKIYQGLLFCLADELFLQEFLRFGSIYKLAGEQAVRRREQGVPVEKVMQEHIALRDVFWEHRRTRSEKVHDFAVEKRMCQCFNNLLQATVQAYQTLEPSFDVMNPLRDPVTGVFNKMYFMTRLEEEVKRSERYLRDVTVILFDIGNTGGGAGENELARAVARVLRRNTRASDILARVAGNRFAVLLPETRREHALRAADRMKEQVREYVLESGRLEENLAIEVGVASYPEHGEGGEILMQEARESINREESGRS